MNRLQWSLCVVGGVLIGLNGLFPPRVHRDSPIWYAGRSCLFSDDLYMFDVERGVAKEEIGGAKITRYGDGDPFSCRPAVVAQGILLAQTALLVGATAAVLALVGLLRRRPRAPTSA